MAEEALPIKFKEHVQLTNVGISTTTITNKSLSMESEKFIYALEKINDENQVVIIDMDDPTNSIRRPILAEISANSSVVSNFEPLDARSFLLGKVCICGHSKFKIVIFCALVLARCSNQSQILIRNTC